VGGWKVVVAMGVAWGLGQLWDLDRQIVDGALFHYSVEALEKLKSAPKNLLQLCCRLQLKTEGINSGSCNGAMGQN